MALLPPLPADSPLRVKLPRLPDRFVAKAQEYLIWTGVGLMLLAGMIWWRERLIDNRLMHAEATCSDVETRQDAAGNLRYFAHLRFRLPDGSLEQFIPAGGASKPQFKTGQKVRLGYPPGNPSHVILADVTDAYGVSIGLGIAGVALFDMGCVFWITKRKREMEQSGAPVRRRRRRRR